MPAIFWAGPCQDPSAEAMASLSFELQHHPTHALIMPPRPFPLPLRIGTDLCNITRIRSLITKRDKGKTGRPLHAFLSKILTHPERSYFHERFGTNESTVHKEEDIARFLAGRCESLGSHLFEYRQLTARQVCSQRSMQESLRSPGQKHERIQAHHNLSSRRARSK